MTTLAEDLARMYADVFDERAAPCTLAGEPVRAIITHDAEVMLGEIYDRRTTAKFLTAETASAGAPPVKGGALVVGDRTYRLDLRLPSGSPHTSLWVIR